MQDPRLAKIADNLITYSLDLQKGETLYIEVRGEGLPLAKEVMRQAQAKGAYPFYRIIHPSLQRELFMGMTEEYASRLKEIEEPMFTKADAFLAINGVINDTELSDVPVERRQVYGKVMREIFRHVDNISKGCLINYPTWALAQKANMSLEAFEDFYFGVCSIDYAKMYQASIPLHELMQQTDRVRITGPGTDLQFSIKDIGKAFAVGRRNMPDGEVYTAPVRDSVNGVITYNTPSTYQGTNFENIQLRFEHGKIVEATSNNTARLNEIFDTDEGARYIGEFAIGIHPLILHPMNDILFDEKIAGSFHFTPGQAYMVADNGNRSAVHWDLINIQRPEYGGGEIWFDDVLIRKDGRFVHESLLGLNPENLLAD
ncbi:aminopeptidase [Brevibacillus dissolubilis]|uniref:aminopeptidase n=1 Tax=Brevibacillus dissolubilis TaxID=1844116 RepID=UPI001116507B|nr:aminopeptidase [Brevibacillus dissolubilis]